MPKYADPCVKCKKKDACTRYMNCYKWLRRYRQRQKQINAYAKKHLPDFEERYGKIEAKKQHPCKTCTKVKSPYTCNNRNCADWKAWYFGFTCRGTIDSGYTGSIHAVLFNHSRAYHIIEKGQKVAQLVILPIITPEPEWVDALEETDRGDGGFGSTGRF